MPTPGSYDHWKLASDAEGRGRAHGCETCEADVFPIDCTSCPECGRALPPLRKASRRALPSLPRTSE